jgi:predicted metalloprotease
MRYGSEDRESDNVEDRRGEGPFPGGGFPGGGRRVTIPMGGGGLGLGGIVLIGILCLMLGINPLTLLTDGGIQLPDMPRPSAPRSGAPDLPVLPGKPGDAVMRAKQRAGSEVQANAQQVKMELQADCLAGVWASLNDQVKSRLEPGDVEEGLRAAAAIGDDALQRKSQGYVVPDAFTHGSSAQRVRWFRRGLDTGQVKACDTFNSKEL